jgi:hypothetical protein
MNNFPRLKYLKKQKENGFFSFISVVTSADDVLDERR